MKHFLLMFSLVFFSTMVSAESDELISFSNGTIADADDVNHNFQLLLKQAEELKSRSKTIIVDCTDNPAALREAYNRNFEKRSLNFEIKGSCYANFANEGAPDYRDIQINHQQITIDGLSDATLIPDEQGIIGLAASFGGGLHLYNLDINVPSDYDRWVILFSRNGYGTVANVNITGGETWNGVIRSQRGANAYIYNTNIDTNKYGVVTENGASVVFFQDNSITSKSSYSLVLKTGSTITSYNDLSTEGTIVLEPGSSFKALGILNFTEFEANGATFNISRAAPTGMDSKFQLENSRGQLRFYDEMEDPLVPLSIFLTGSDVSISRNDAGDNLTPLTVNSLNLGSGSSSFVRTALRFEKINVTNSALTLRYFDETYMQGEYVLLNSFVQIESKPFESIQSLGSFTCRGLSSLDITGTIWTSEITNCRSARDW